MKTKHLLYGAMAMLMLPACVNDLDVGTSEEQETNAKIRINIVSAGGTRADSDYQDGIAAENAIDNIKVVFYDAQKNYMFQADISNANKIPDGEITEAPNVEKVKTVEATVAIKDGVFPSYIMVFANPISNIYDNGTLSTYNKNYQEFVENTTSTDYLGQNKNFSMSNSVYFNQETGELMRAVPVYQKNFYVNESGKESAETVTVYIERMAAKVTLKSAYTDTQEGKLNDHDLKFNVTAWGINGCAQSCYLTKRFNGYNYLTESNKIDGAFTWNDQSRSRSYWAITPHYYLAGNNILENGMLQYPWVSEQANKGSVLKYHTYNEICNTGGAYGKKIGDSMYGLENTVDKSFYTNTGLNVNAALVHAVVAGYYTVDEEVKDFYIYGGEFYLEDEYLKAMAKLAAVIKKKTADNKIVDLDDEDTLTDVFEIYHPTEALGSSKGVEENKVTIRLKENIASQYVYQTGNNAAKTITASDRATINNDIKANCGLASMYKDGKAYFYVPIKHLGYPAGTVNSLPIGSYGLVRNHSYVITVGGFEKLTTTSLGHGVREPKDPIVPPSDPDENYGIKANINVLSWRIVDQYVTLGEK